MLYRIPAYRRWARRGVPEGALLRDWRIHLIALYRNERFQTQSRRIDCARCVVRRVLGLPPRFYARSHPDRPWGHGYYDYER